MYTAHQESNILKHTKAYLSKEVTKSDIQGLSEAIRYHEWRYHIKYDPVISDFEYDSLFKSLQDLETNHPELITNDSPSQRVANDLTKDFESVRHLTPMLSLANSYNADDLKDFDEQIKKLTGLDENSIVEYCVEPKFDGGSVAVVYTDDQLTRAATRGNGESGEEMTPNAKVLPTIPLKASFSKMKIHTAELRGEAVIHKDRFDKINEYREKSGDTVFANPRNAAAGGLRMKNPNETRHRGIEIFIFQLGYGVDIDGNDVLYNYDSHFEQINLLSNLGFKVSLDEKKKCNGIEEVISFAQAWEAKREDYPYELDGMVIKVDSLKLQKKCGMTQHHPRWAIAYKFKAKQATTRLLDVEYQVGKIGSITPVAKLDPVKLAGVTISSVSLHNQEFIESKDLHLGDMVLVERAGDVIPYIVKSLKEYREADSKAINFPSVCPVCSTSLLKAEGESAWRCVNDSCKGQQLQRLIFHVSKDAMDIDGFGKSYVEQFQELGWLDNISDIYNIDYDKVKQLEGFGEKSANKLHAAIEKAKQNPIKRLLYSLTVHHLGKKASKLIAEQIEHVLDLQEWTKENFTEIKDIGPVVADNVIAYFGKAANVNMLKRMEELGVNLKQTEADKPTVVAENAPLREKTILFTGTLTQMGRKEAQKLAEVAGARNISAVSSNLNILVAGEKAGSKLKKAQALGTVEILTEDEFLKIING